MPDISIRLVNIAALSTNRPFSETSKNWRFRRCPYPRGLYTILARHNGAAGGCEHAVLIGTTEVVQRGETNGGGTDGVCPVPDNTPAHQFYATENDEIALEIYETGNVATTDVMVYANVEPA
jgi:hypothetical protein